MAVTRGLSALRCAARSRRPCLHRTLCAASRRSASPPPAGWEAGHAEDAPFALPRVYLTYDAVEAERLLRRHVWAENDSGGASTVVLGLDTEARPRGFGGTGATALLQLATPRAVLLLPMLRLPRLPALQRLLARQHTLLVGVGVHDDTAALPATGATPVDVALAATRHAAAAAAAATPQCGMGLAALVEHLGGPPLNKSRRITLSNWEAAPLSDAQVSYAALDAYASGWAAWRLHARLCAEAARAGAPPLPPLAQWLLSEAALQAAEREERRRRAGEATAALLRCAGEAGAAGVSQRKLVELASAQLPDIGVSFVGNQLSKLLRKGLLMKLRAPIVDDEADATTGARIALPRY